MTFSGDEILACPHCKHIYKNHIIASYNTFNVDPYSDGHTEGLLPNFISVIKCQQDDCGEFFHIDEAEKLGEILKNDDIASFPVEWQEATPLYGYRIGAKELEESLNTDFCKNRNNEIIVRTLLLRRKNDVCRKNRNHQLPQEEKTAFTNNIDKLIELHNGAESAAAKINVAELYREKGDFNSCISILGSIDSESENERTIKEKIYSQAKVKDDKVFNIHHAAIKKEYQCNSCGDSLVLFDLEKINSNLDYKHYRCVNDNTVFNASSKISNPEPYYRLTFLQKLFKTKKPYERLKPNEEIKCPTCQSKNIEIFDPETEKCLNCNYGEYKCISWFN